LLPLIAGEGEKHWSRRPVAVLMVTLIAVTLGTFTHLGLHTPWSPAMDSWSSDPVPASFVVHRTPLERRGALLLQQKQCRNCHSIGGVGGRRGPALDAVATEMTGDQIVRQILQGGGNMPAYGKALSPEETTAITQYLRTLRGPGLRPAADASQGLQPQNASHPVDSTKGASGAP
jgi:ubiquinol-cytochrome c reductase cytochrome b subunit